MAEAVMLGVGALGAADSFVGAKQQNKQTRRAAAVQRTQAKIQARQKHAQLAREKAQALGSARANAAARGASGASTAAAFRAIAALTAEQGANVDTNLAFQNAAITGASNTAQIANNPFSAGLAGGLSGLQAGAGIAEGFDIKSAFPKKKGP